MVHFKILKSNSNYIFSFTKRGFFSPVLGNDVIWQKITAPHPRFKKIKFFSRNLTLGPKIATLCTKIFLPSIKYFPSKLRKTTSQWEALKSDQCYFCHAKKSSMFRRIFYFFANVTPTIMPHLNISICQAIAISA